MWPDLEAILVVPNTHALFARPMVTRPRSRGSRWRSTRAAARRWWCDGRRQLQVPPGARIRDRAQSTRPLKWLRIDRPFADRLVTKFKLPVTGWRGGNDAGVAGRE